MLPNRHNLVRIRPRAVGKRKACPGPQYGWGLSTGRAGFTIFELLAVISLLSVLLAILLPAIQGARDAARMAVCVSNEHQFGIASLTYMGDSGGWWPVCGSMQDRDFGVDSSPLWTYVLAEMMGRGVYSTEHGDYVGVTPFESLLVLDRDGDKDNGVFQCPSDNRSNYWGGPNACSYGWNSGRNYKYGMGLTDWEGLGVGLYPELDDTEKLGRVRFNKVLAPSNTFVIADALGALRLPPIYEEALTPLRSIFHSTFQMSDLHRDSGNYLWADGRVSNMLPEDVLVEHFDRRQ